VGGVRRRRTSPTSVARTTCASIEFAARPGRTERQPTDSAIRITHLPNGLVVQCQDGSRNKKRPSAQVLRARLLDLEPVGLDSETPRGGAQGTIGSGDRKRAHPQPKLPARKNPPAVTDTAPESLCTSWTA